MAGDPPKKRGRPRKIKVEETSSTDGAVADVVQTSDQEVAAPTKVEGEPIDDLVAQAVQIDNQLAVESPASSRKGRKKIEVVEIAESGNVELPPISEWPGYFPSTLANKARASIMNAERARQLADAFVPAKSREKVIVEAFPGAYLCSQTYFRIQF